MRRRADQPHDAALDIRQQHVLLRLVEAVDFVNEQNRGLPLVLQPVRRRGQHAAHVGHVGFHAAQPLELALGLAGDDLRQRSFAGARRAVKDQRLDAVGLDGAAQQLARAEDVRLADELAQVARPHARRQRLMSKGALLRRARIRRACGSGEVENSSSRDMQITITASAGFAQNKKARRRRASSPHQKEPRHCRV